MTSNSPAKRPHLSLPLAKRATSDDDGAGQLEYTFHTSSVGRGPRVSRPQRPLYPNYSFGFDDEVKAESSREFGD